MINYRLVSHYLATMIFLWLIGLTQTFAGEFPLFDAHVHYNKDIWQAIPTDDAIERLKKQGIRRAIVSSTSDDGAIKLFKQNPELVIPFLRPYRSPADRRDWYKNPDILKYVSSQLESFDYQGLGEFHLFDSQVKTPVMKEILALARKKNLILLAHSDHETIDALLTAAPNLTVIWAHGGFDVDVNIVAKKLKQNRNLYIELSFREGITEQGVLTPRWRELFLTSPARFLVGTDTYTGQRWLALPELADHYQGWLKQLPGNIAEANHNLYDGGGGLTLQDRLERDLDRIADGARDGTAALGRVGLLLEEGRVGRRVREAIEDGIDMLLEQQRCIFHDDRVCLP